MGGGGGLYDSRLVNKEEKGIAVHTCNPDSSCGPVWKWKVILGNWQDLVQNKMDMGTKGLVM